MSGFFDQKRKAIRITYSLPESGTDDLSRKVQGIISNLHRSLEQTKASIDNQSWQMLSGNFSKEAGDLERFTLYQVSEEIKPDESKAQALADKQREFNEFKEQSHVNVLEQLEREGSITEDQRSVLKQNRQQLSSLSAELTTLKIELGKSFFENFITFFEKQGRSEKEIQLIIDILVQSRIGVPFTGFGQEGNFVLEAVSGSSDICHIGDPKLHYDGYRDGKVVFTVIAPIQKSQKDKKKIGTATMTLSIDLTRRTFSKGISSYDIDDKGDIKIRKQLPPGIRVEILEVPSQKRQAPPVIKSIKKKGAKFNSENLKSLLIPHGDQPPFLSSCVVAVEGIKDLVKFTGQENINWDQVIGYKVEFNERCLGIGRGKGVVHYLKDGNGYEQDDYVLSECDEKILFLTMQLIAAEGNQEIDIQDVQNFCRDTNQEKLFTIAYIAAHVHGLTPYLGNDPIDLNRLDQNVIKETLNQWHQNGWINEKQRNDLLHQLARPSQSLGG